MFVLLAELPDSRGRIFFSTVLIDLRAELFPCRNDNFFDLDKIVFSSFSSTVVDAIISSSNDVSIP